MTKSKIYFPAYIITVLIVIILAFEFVILPWHFDLPRDIALTGFAGKPNSVVDDTSINSLGFTGDVINEKKSPGKLRILTLGGSAMFNRRMAKRLKESL